MSAIYSHGDQFQMDFTPAVAVAAGTVLSWGGGNNRVVGVNNDALVANRLGSVDTDAAYRVDKADGSIFAQGDSVWFDEGNAVAVVAGDAAADFVLGYCVADGGNPAADTIVLTRLTPLVAGAGSSS